MKENITNREDEINISVTALFFNDISKQDKETRFLYKR